MTCTCPKCHVQMEVDMPPLADDGADAKCPACNARFQLIKESFATRALRSGELIACVNCGSTLGHSTFCPGCRELFPEYLVSATARKRKKKTRKIYVQSGVFTGIPQLGSEKRSPGARPTSAAVKPQVKAALASVVIIALLVAGGAFLYQQRVEKQYAQKYMRALYLLKGGTEGNIMLCGKLSADWKARMDSGQSFTPRISPHEETNVNEAKGVLDELMKQFKSPPGKFARANERLLAVHGIYTKSYSLVTTLAGSQAALADATANTERDLKQAVQDLKGSLPEALTEELKGAKSKYRELRDL